MGGCNHTEYEPFLKIKEEYIKREREKSTNTKEGKAVEGHKVRDVGSTFFCQP